MYICICKGVTDNKIRQAIANGASSMHEVRSELGVASQCGKCGSAAKQVVREALAEQASFNNDLFYVAG